MWQLTHRRWILSAIVYGTLFAAFPVQPIPLQDSEREQAQQAPAKADANPFACDDPTAGLPSSPR